MNSEKKAENRVFASTDSHTLQSSLQVSFNNCQVEMTMGKAILFMIGLVVLASLYIWGAMTLANVVHGYVHVGKTVKTTHRVHHKGYTHTRHGSPIGTWNIPTLHAGVTSHIIIKVRA